MNIIFLLFALCASELSFAITFDTNVPKRVQNQMTEDLEFIEKLEGSTQSELHQEIFGDLSGDSYLKFFNQRVSAVGVNTCGGGNAVACVIPVFNSSKMWLTRNYTQFSHPQIARLMVVFHEARHTETRNQNWGHAHCPNPFLDADGHPITSIWTGSNLADEPACDETAYGSYGSSLILLKNISKFCTNCTEKVKLDASLYADDQLKRIIDEKSTQQIREDLYRN